MEPEMPDNDDRRDLQNRIDDVHSRVTDAEKASIERDGKLDGRIERVTACTEEQGRNITRIEKVSGRTADDLATATAGISDLKTMHAEFLKENKYTCEAVQEAQAIATAARTKAEDVEIATRPIVQEHEKEIRSRSESRRDWRRIFIHVIAYLIGAGVVFLAGVLASGIPIF